MDSSLSTQTLDWQLLCVAVAIWECLYQLAKAACARYYKQWPKVATAGGSYLTATLNACVCSVAGAWLVLQHGHATEPLIIHLTAHSFLGWLMMDLIHLFTHFPALGGWDMVAHHVGFICLTSLAHTFNVLRYAMGWMLLGEISSIFLNLRWFLISSGRGESTALARTNLGFAVTFFAFRIVVFWVGLYDMLLNVRPMLIAPPHRQPALAINTVCAFVVGSALLNCFWMVKIVRMATRSKRSDEAALVSSKREAHIRRDGSQEELSEVESASSWPASPKLAQSPSEVAVHRV